MSEQEKALTEEELEAIFTAGAGWADEVTFARIKATIEAQQREIERLNCAHQDYALEISKQTTVKIAKLKAEIEQLLFERECDLRDPAHGNCRNVEAQLNAALSTTIEENAKLKAEIERKNVCVHNALAEIRRESYYTGAMHGILERKLEEALKEGGMTDLEHRQCPKCGFKDGSRKAFYQASAIAREALKPATVERCSQEHTTEREYWDCDSKPIEQERGCCARMPNEPEFEEIPSWHLCNAKPVVSGTDWCKDHQRVVSLCIFDDGEPVVGTSDRCKRHEEERRVR